MSAKHYTINGKDLKHFNHTMLDSLPAIFAAEFSGHYDENSCKTRYKLDDENLKEVISDADTAISGLIDAVRVVGNLLAFVDHKEIGDSVDSVGWVLSGIAGIAQKVHDARIDFQYDLETRKK
jgi:hypothetical protein